VSSDQRLPANYQIVLDVVNDTAHGSHVNAQEIYLRARLRQPKIGFATVHRSLARLSDLGYVLKLDVPGAPSAIYEPATSPHAHFRCTVCGAIADLAFALPESTRVEIATRHGLNIHTEALTFSGTCETCARETP
jgi:Fe2+ or Zn2+ uptake regulation protein